MQRPNRPATAATGDAPVESVAPTLRVMRLQKPALHVGSTLSNSSALQNALCLPDSLAVYVGETFRAYLGILNTSSTDTIRRLAVTAQLQTPTQRWTLPSSLEHGIDHLPPESSVDAIVSHAIEQPGQHILRVEVSYQDSKTFRKFYRFQVVPLLEILSRVRRMGDTQCLVQVTLSYQHADAQSAGPLVLSNVQFLAAPGLTATRLDAHLPKTLDDACQVDHGSQVRVLFQLEASSPEAMAKGLAVEDTLGYVSVEWRKAMGESGVVTSPTVVVPPVQLQSKGFVVHRSGWSVDVAKESARSAHQARVTVEPIDPPTRLKLLEPTWVQFLVVNHTSTTRTLQLQFKAQHGLAVAGPNRITLDPMDGQGGSQVTRIRILALSEGLWTLENCTVVDLVDGTEVRQPPLFATFVGEAEEWSSKETTSS